MVGNHPIVHERPERLKLLVFDGFRLVTLHFARFIDATIARHKVIVIDFNHDDGRSALAARYCTLNYRTFMNVSVIRFHASNGW